MRSWERCSANVEGPPEAAESQQEIKRKKIFVKTAGPPDASPRPSLSEAKSQWSGKKRRQASPGRQGWREQGRDRARRRQAAQRKRRKSARAS
jgi:hypothetical protein